MATGVRFAQGHGGILALLTVFALVYRMQDRIDPWLYKIVGAMLLVCPVWTSSVRSWRDGTVDRGQALCRRQSMLGAAG